MPISTAFGSTLVRPRAIGGWADALGARAFAYQGQIVVGSHESAQDHQLVAHEAVHAWQQTRSPDRYNVIQRQPKPGATPLLTEQTVEGWTDTQLASTEDQILEQLEKLTPDSRLVLEANLGAVQHEMLKRKLPVKPYWGMRLATKLDEHASPSQIASLQIQFDILVAMLENAFPAHCASTVARLKDERGRVESIHRDDVLFEGDRIEASQTSVDKLAQVSRGLPATATIGVEKERADLERALTIAVQALATSQENAWVRETQAASERYLDSLTRLIVVTAGDMKTALAQTSVSFSASNGFIDGYARNNRIVMPSTQNELLSYQFYRRLTLKEFAELGDLASIAGSPFAVRAKFLEDKGEQVTRLMKRGRALLLMSTGFECGVILAEAVTSATDNIEFGDACSARAIRDALVNLAAALPGTPSDGDLAAASATIDAERGVVLARVKDVERYLQTVGTAMKVLAIAASLYGGIVAMEAAGGSGLVVSASGMHQIAMGQFIRGSLAFTMGSQMVNSFVANQPLTPAGVAQQAMMDMATLGMMHSVGAGLALGFNGATNVPVGLQYSSQFATLWAWSTGLSLASQPGPITVEGALNTVVETGTNTAIGFLALGVGQRLRLLPSMSQPSGPTLEVPRARRTALAEFEALRSRGLKLNESISRWAERGRLPEELDGLMQQAESWYGSLRSSLKGLADVGVLDAAQVEALVKNTGLEVAQIRNIRDMGRLGLQESGGSTIAYGGDVRNLEFFLGRIARQGTIKGYVPVGRGGIYKVTGLDERISFYYPEGAAPESGRSLDLAVERWKDCLPGVPAEVRAQASATLRGLPSSEATRVALELAGPGGESVLRWLAELGATGEKPRFLSGQLLIDCANDANLMRALRGERSTDLNAWARTKFEKIGGNRGGRSFLELLNEVKSRRGSLRVSGPSEAAMIVDEIASASLAFEVRSQAEISATGSPRKPRVSDWVEAQQRRSMTGQFLEVSIDGAKWILQVRGSVVRAWIWSDGATTAEFDVAATLDRLRKGLAVADAQVDPVHKAAAIEALKPLADTLAFLRKLRGVEFGDALTLLERVNPTQRPAGELAPAEEPPVELPQQVPVTTRQLFVARRQQLLKRASHQGMSEDPYVEALTKWNPRKGTDAPSDPTATLDFVEKYLDRKRDAAIGQYKRRFGAAEIERLKRTAFGGRADFGDFLAASSGMHGLSLEALRGLGYMTQAPPEGEPAIRINKILETTRPASERNLVLEQFARIMESQPGGIPGAYRMISDMTSGKGSWKGGMWTLRSLARNTHVKLTDVAGFEQTETALLDPNNPESALVRRYDVVMKSGERIELKSWGKWWSGTIRSQSCRDFVLRTRSFANLDNFDQMRYLFDGPPGVVEQTRSGPRFKPLSESEARAKIRAELEQGLEDAMNEVGIKGDQRARIRGRFQRFVEGMIIVDSTPVD